MKVKVNGASGGPAQRALGVALFSFVWFVAGFYPVVAVAGWVALLAWHLKATRNLPGAQPAVVLVWLRSILRCAGCTPGRTLVGAPPAR